MRGRPSAIPEQAEPFDPAAELDWGRPDFSRRLLREHLDQSHDGASRRLGLVGEHVRRLRRLLPPPPAQLLDAGCGPGLYTVRLARLGHDVLGVDVGEAVLRHARTEARRLGARGRARFRRADLRDLRMDGRFDAVLLIYFVLEALPRTEQPRFLRSLAASLKPGGTLIAELRLRPDQPPGRSTWWDVVDESVLADRRHLLLGDSQWDPRRHTYVLREIAVFDDGRIATQQTSGWLCPFSRIPALFATAGLRVRQIYDEWSAEPGTALSESVLVVAEKPALSRTRGPRPPAR